DVLLANDILLVAFWTVVRPALAAFREERGLPADPFGAFRASGYEEKVAAERVGGNQMGWGA
ncbi:MAG: L-rhamnose isomerase, partial [Brachybacterium tyrofermentans]